MRTKKVKNIILPRYLRVDKQKAQGVVYTPSWIVQLILEEVGYVRSVGDGGALIDPSCGEGAFLLEAVRYLIEAARKEGWSSTDIRSTLESRIWGIDIDPSAIARAQQRLNTLLQAQGIPPVRWSLFVADALDPLWIAQHSGQFRYVVGNPPYVRIQHLGQERRRRLQNHFHFCQTGNTDLYIAFFEAGLHLLEEEGYLGYITPNTYFYTKTAQKFRTYLAQSGFLRKVIDFRDQQVFAGVTTYTAITILQKGPRRKEVLLAEGIAPTPMASISEKPVRPLGVCSSDFLEPQGWTIAPPTIVKRLQEIRHRGQPLGQIARIHVGITTLADELYIFRHPKWEGDRVQIRLKDGQRFWVEAALLRPIVKVSILKDPHENQDRWILFPYEKINGRYTLIPEKELAERYPLTYQYFLAVRDRLLLRDKGKPNPYGWYAFGRHQGLDTTWGKKILVPPIAKEPRFIVWERPEYTYYAGYGIHYEGDLWALAAQLQSEDMALFLRYVARCYQGGYYSLAKSFIEHFGVILRS